MADTILVIDDSVTVRTAVRWVTESDGYRVLEASSLQEARSLLETEQPDSVLLDYHLPDGKGVDFCAELRQDPRFGSLRIIILHGDAHPFEPADARSARATGALRKPFRSDTLLGLLEGDLGQATVEVEAAAAPPAPAPIEVDEETIFSDADIVDETPRAPAPPSPERVRTRSGAFRTPPMPGSGLHRLPPPGGQPVKVAGRGTMPRSPSGAFRAVDVDIPDSEDAPLRTPTPTPSTPQHAVEVKPAEAQLTETQPVDLQRAPDIEPSQAQPAAAQPAPVVQKHPRHDPTAEMDVLDEKDIADAPDIDTHQTDGISEEALRARIDEVLGAVIEERIHAIIEEELPNIARRALAGLLRTELNEQIVRLGVTRRVQQFLDDDLPNYAHRAVERRLEQDNES